MKREIKNKLLGFTIIELLIVIGIITVLVAVAVVSINPSNQLLNARNNQRKVHVETIYGAIEHYSFYERSLPPCFSTVSVGEEFDAIACEADLTPLYLAEMPKDPVYGNGNTGYLLREDVQTGRVGVKASGEGEGNIFAGHEWE